jgi:two-component system sensor histidine kinase MtrB
MRPLRSLVGSYQRSLTLRVIIGTLVLSSVVVTLVGWMLMQQVTTGLLAARVGVVVAATAATSAEAEASLSAADPATNTSELYSQLTEDIADRGGAAGTYGVVLALAPTDNPTDTRPSRQKGPADWAEIPADLRESIQTSRVAYRFASAVRAGREVPVLVSGTRLAAEPSGQSVTLFYVFPLDQERNTLALVQQALLVAGVLLVALLCGVSVVVTRQIVGPVRQARRVSERLAAGRLEERTRIPGSDDLARLGTSINHMAANLQRQIGQLEELSRVQRRFVSDVSHELRTPLTTVRMAADVLYESRAAFDSGLARSTELMEAELDRFESLLADLLEISRFDAGAAALEAEPIDMRGLVERAIESTKGLATRRGIEVSAVLPPEPCIVECDGRRVERIMRNLVSNAVEYGALDKAPSSDSRVAVRLAADAAAVAITVRDHGIGLQPGEAVLVFNRFWRADPARAKTRGGTGLGLAISLEDAQLHGGWLQAWGEPGRGSTFRLTLPRQAGAPLTHSPLPLVPAEVALEQYPHAVSDPAGSSATRDGFPRPNNGIDHDEADDRSSLDRRRAPDRRVGQRRAGDRRSGPR